MGHFRDRGPSASMVVAIAALVVALSGTALAASSLVSGDKLIKKNSLSGNRLRKHTVTGKQINLSSLGKVPSAIHADSATNAGHASTAANATGAADAGELGGEPPSAYAASSLFGRPGPQTSSGPSEPYCVVSEIKLLAGNQVPSDWHLADGSLLPISSNAALYSLLGTTYGGDGKTTFALPDLRAADPKGGGPAGVSYYICTSGWFP